MNAQERTLVADIKTRYKREKTERLAIQKDMVKLRDKFNWSQQEIADATGIPQRTVSNWLEAYDEGLSNPAKASRLTPASAQAASDRAVAARVIKAASEAEIKGLIAALPRERQQAIAAAAGDAYAGARRSYERGERELTPAQQRERREASERLTRPAREMIATFSELGIVDRLEQIRDELRELAADGSLTVKLVKSVSRAVEELETELRFARQLVGIED